MASKKIYNFGEKKTEYNIKLGKEVDVWQSPKYIEAKNNYSDLIINANGHQEILNQYLDIMSRHFYSYLELMQDIGHDILIEEDVLWGSFMIKLVATDIDGTILIPEGDFTSISVATSFIILTP